MHKITSVKSSNNMNKLWPILLLLTACEPTPRLVLEARSQSHFDAFDSLNVRFWQKGLNARNTASTVNGILSLPDVRPEGSWIVTNGRYPTDNIEVIVKVETSSADASLELSNQVDYFSTNGLGKNNSFYQFYNAINDVQGPLYIRRCLNTTRTGNYFASGVDFTRRHWLRIGIAKDTVNFSYSFDNSIWHLIYREKNIFGGDSLYIALTGYKGWSLSSFRMAYSEIATDTVTVVRETPRAWIVWNDNTEADLAGYRLYVRNDSAGFNQSFDTGLISTYQISNLDTVGTYSVQATAYDTVANESPKSNTVRFKYVPLDTVPPDTTKPDSISWCDLNDDGKIDLLDRGMFNWSFPSQRGESNYRVACDKNNDDVVDGLDLGLLARWCDFHDGKQLNSTAKLDSLYQKGK